MVYTEEILAKYACPLAENINEANLERMELHLQKLLRSGYKQESRILRKDSSASYYSVELVAKDGLKLNLHTVGAYALNIVGPADDELSYELTPLSDNTFEEYHKAINRKNRTTNYAFKKLLRILKHILADMQEQNIPKAEDVKPDAITEMAFAMPDEVFMRFDTLSEKLQYILLQDEKAGKLGELLKAMRLFVQLK